MAYLTPAQRQAQIEAIARVINGEAANQGWEGMTAVGNVVMNRAAMNFNGWSNDPVRQALRPNQFTALNPLHGRRPGNRLGQPGAPLQPGVLEAATAVVDGTVPDYSRGAASYNVASGRNVSRTGRQRQAVGSPTVRIGAHQFYNDAPTARDPRALAAMRDRFSNPESPTYNPAIGPIGTMGAPAARQSAQEGATLPGRISSPQMATDLAPAPPGMTAAERMWQGVQEVAGLPVTAAIRAGNATVEGIRNLMRRSAEAQNPQANPRTRQVPLPPARPPQSEITPPAPAPFVQPAHPPSERDREMITSYPMAPPSAASEAPPAAAAAGAPTTTGPVAAAAQARPPASFGLVQPEPGQMMSQAVSQAVQPQRTAERIASIFAPRVAPVAGLAVAAPPPAPPAPLAPSAPAPADIGMGLGMPGSLPSQGLSPTMAAAANVPVARSPFRSQAAGEPGAPAPAQPSVRARSATVTPRTAPGAAETGPSTTFTRSPGYSGPGSWSGFNGTAAPAGTGGGFFTSLGGMLASVRPNALAPYAFGGGSSSTLGGGDPHRAL
jgi:Cell Wall Hydrolase